MNSTSHEEMIPNKVLSFFIALRLASVYLVRTWYVPDEYWQSLEVAHRIAFGYGHLTWEWTQGIRSYLYPSLIAGLYKLLALVQYDQVELLVLLPRILQALISAYSDYRFYQWSNKSKWSIFVLASSWFWFYTASRTLANTLETSLTVIALSQFPWESSECTKFLWPVMLSIFIRPTSVIPWIPLCFYHLKKSAHPVWELLLKRYLPIGIAIGILSIAVDTFHHGSLLTSPYEFLRYNVFKGIGSFYGEHPWYWYFNVGLPTILGIGTLPFLLSTVETLRNRNVFKEKFILLTAILFTVIVYSALPHKEFRFLLQILPICLYLSADYLSRWSRKASGKLVWLAAIVLLTLNVIPAGYLSHTHQRGTIDVMSSLQTIAKEYRDEYNQPAKLIFLMPCHSTPFHSHVHQNITMRFLHCEPNLTNDENYLDEAATFYKDPMGWIRKNLPVHPRSALPSHVIAFDSLEPKIKDFLSIYEKKETFFHSDYTTDRIGSNVVIYERFDPSRVTTTQEPTPQDNEEIQPNDEGEP
ncbi:GPI mannosyltransferase 3-like isoform X2 [Uranotaenia lowii]|uniref:GPI mannosyltransferase 3-like isoform X2 n=1 Tax=Uranotaenia lowii TaxID=190385 RepID=UPI00247A3D4E|nr:GPI mannosyltransferase 3-like isoform X2 [Uranotaenia lowii]XP_055613028.1 GPI mannosyltransferase 3-like isoform X2 [Uranotaenia lowii]